MKTRKRTDILNITAHLVKKRKGVKSENDHTWFEVDNYLFDPNDFHKSNKRNEHWYENRVHVDSKKLRPLYARKTILNDGVYNKGMCHRLSQAMSNFWFKDDTHDMNTKEKINWLINCSRQALLNKF